MSRERTTDNDALPKEALSGLRVLDAGQIIAGPVSAGLLGDFGAEVIKIEQPGEGDMFRGNRSPVLWSLLGRNKKSVTLNLSVPKGQELFKRLVAISDVVVENFMPGTMERWGLGYEELSSVNPGVVMLRISGYGQTGPYSRKPGLDRIGLAVGGITYVTGYPDHPPVRPGFMVADYATGMLGALGVLIAIHYRDVVGTGRGQMIDLALFETVFRMSGDMVGQYHREGIVQERMGNVLRGIAPADQWETKDGKWLVIQAGTDRLFHRLCKAMGQPELARDLRFSGRAERTRNQDAIQDIVGQWVKGHTLEEALAILEREAIPASTVYSVADIFQDPQYAAREDIIEVETPLGEKVKMPGIVPKLSLSPGAVFRAAPRLGEHNEEVYCGLLRLDREELERLGQEGIV